MTAVWRPASMTRRTSSLGLVSLVSCLSLALLTGLPAFLTGAHRPHSNVRLQSARVARNAGDDEYKFGGLVPGMIPTSSYKKGDKLDGIVTAIGDRGCWVDIGTEKSGFVPISKIKDVGRVEKIEDEVQVGQGVNCWVIDQSSKGLVLSLSEKKVFSYPRGDISEFEGVDPETWIPGQVVDVKDFGAFVAMESPSGAEGRVQGLVHISQIKDGVTKKVSDEVSIGDAVKVRVLEVKNDKVGLTMKPVGSDKKVGGKDFSVFDDVTPDQWLTGTVTGFESFGAFVDVVPPNGGEPITGLVHITQISDDFVEDAQEELEQDQEVQVRVIEADSKRGRLSLSLRPVPEREEVAN